MFKYSPTFALFFGGFSNLPNWFGLFIWNGFNALFLLYPDKWKAVAYSVMWTVILFVLPLLVVSPNALLIQYQNWFAMLSVDKPVQFSLSVLGWLK